MFFNFLMEEIMKKFWILPVAVFVMFLAVSCGSGSDKEEKRSKRTECNIIV